MRKNLLRMSILVATLVATGREAGAQTTNRFYTELPKQAAAANKPEKSFTKYRLVQVDLTTATQYAQNYAAVGKGSSTTAPGVITLPMPDGTDVLFNLTLTKVLVDDLAALHPEIQTFNGSSVDGKHQLKLTIAPSGIGAVIYSEGFKAYVSTIDPKNPGVVIAYNVKNVIVPAGLKCGTADEPVNNNNNSLHKDIHGEPLFGDCSLRTYVLSIAATGEFTTWAGSQAAALASITTTVNNINAIYERDLAIHFTLNSPNGILYTNSSTDPYATVSFPSSATLNSNQTAIDGVVTSANYDQGLVFNDGWNGGLAQLQSVCGSSKARGAAGLDHTIFTSGPSGSIFENTVAHEMGHQFGANHSFAANNGSCSGNTNGATGWEPGGGSTIMAYAGSCTGNYYQFYSDNYFHGGNLAEMATYMTGTGNSCATITSSGNTNPVNTFGPTSFTIPNSTPFKLSSGGTDADASDVLTYTWEQLNAIGGSGTSSAPSATATSGPNFRSYPPSSSPTRYFPSLAILTGNASGTYEVLPTVARTMNFRSTVRDNHAGAGCTANQDVTVTTSSCGPFSITSHTSAGSFVANGSNTTTLTWNTASACVTCTNINIKFSTDGGNTFPYTILSNTPNDGTQLITVPNLPTCSGRFLIECPTNIYFNINSANQTITSSCTANGSTITPSTDLTVATPGNAALNMSLSPQYGTSYGSSISGSVTSGDAAGSLSYYITGTSSCNVGGNSINYDAYTIVPSVTGTYTFTGAGSNPFGLMYNLYSTSYDASSPCNNFLASSGTAATSASSVTLNSSVASSLCAGQKYVLLVSSFGSGFPSLPASYTVNITTPVGGALFNGTPQPSGLNYCYVMVKNSTGSIVAINSSANLTNTTNYPAGNYTVYGISSSSTCTALNTSFAGQAFTTLNSAALNQTSGLCANISTNYRRVAIGSTPLAVKLLSFDATLKSNSDADVNWSMAQETDIKNYELQRSIDGQHFETVTTLPAYNKNSFAAQGYGYTDINIPHGISTVYYRLKIVEYTSTEFSGIVPLKLRTTGTSVIISPNPVQNDVLAASIITAGNGSLNASVCDMTGRILARQQLNTQEGANRLSMPVGHLAPGMYILRVETNGTIENVRFIKSM